MTVTLDDLTGDECECGHHWDAHRHDDMDQSCGGDCGCEHFARLEAKP